MIFDEMGMTIPFHVRTSIASKLLDNPYTTSHIELNPIVTATKLSPNLPQQFDSVSPGSPPHFGWFKSVWFTTWFD